MSLLADQYPTPRSLPKDSAVLCIALDALHQIFGMNLGAASVPATPAGIEAATFLASDFPLAAFFEPCGHDGTPHIFLQVKS